MFQDPVSQLADLLLAVVPRDPRAPHYRESSFRRKLDDAARRERKLPSPPEPRCSPYLIHREWEDVTRAARLTEAQVEVILLRLKGLTFEEIGTQRGCTKQGAQRVFSQGARKLMVAWESYPYRGLAEVYQEEVRRRRVHRR